jgi:hypothetical protein
MELEVSSTREKAPQQESANGTTTVYFPDSLIPLRIPYHPDGILEVVVEDAVNNSICNSKYDPNATIGHISQGTMATDWIHTANRSYGSFNEGTALQAPLTSVYSPFSPYSVGTTADIDSVSQQAASLFISSAQSGERTLAVYQGTTDTEAFPLTYAPHQTYNLNMGAITTQSGIHNIVYQGGHERTLSRIDPTVEIPGISCLVH